MRRSIVLAFLVAVLAVVTVVWLRSGARDGVEPADPGTGAAKIESIGDAPDTAAPICVVRGRLLDADGAPIAGAQVRLFASGVWADGIDVPRFGDRTDVRGFEVATDDTGAFRIEAPLPTAPRPVLEIRPDRFHDLVTLHFGATRDDELPPLVAREHDLGDLRVARTGALRGRVLDADGSPVADVRVGIGESRTSTLDRDARTGADGIYVLAHAPAGTYGVRVQAEGRVFHFEPGIRVEAGRDTLVRDVVLARSPTIEGSVTDEQGRPLAGVKLRGWPTRDGGGIGVFGTSGPDGRFVLPLPHDEPFTLTAKLDGHETWGDERDETVTYEPGRRELAVVLRAAARTRFVVVDGETGAPVESFGLGIVADNGSRSPHRVSSSRRPPIATPHPGGGAEATARAGVDLYVVGAEGYLLATGDVEHDVAGVPVQTVRMQRGVGLRGRALRDGAALADAVVEVAAIARFLPDEKGRPGRERFWIDANTRRTAHTDGEGRFAVGALEPGEFRLTLRPARGAALVRAPVRVADRGTTDLGDLHVLAGATIVGELRVPPGTDPAGNVVRLDGRQDGQATLVDGAGRFRFEDVAVGVRFLAHESRAGAVDDGPPVRLELASGETRTVTIETRECTLCAVDLRIDLGDVPAAGCRATLSGTDLRDSLVELGTCDASGRVQGTVRAFGSAHVEAWLPGDRRVRHPDVVLELAPMSRVEAVVRFELARLDLRIPVALPRDGHVDVRLVPDEPGKNEQSARLTFVRGAPVDESAAVRSTGDGVSVGGLLAGKHALIVEAYENGEQVSELATNGGGRYWRATSPVVLVAGQTLALAP